MPNRSALHEEVYGVAMALLMVAALTAVMTVVHRYFIPTNRSIIYLIPVIAAASLWGVLPAVTAAVAGIVAAVFFFYPPVYSFKIPATPQLINLTLFLVIALVTGRLATAARAQAELARKREKDVRELYAFSRRLGAADAASDIYAAIQEHLSRLIQRRGVLFQANPSDPAESESSDSKSVPERVRDEVTRYAAGAMSSDGSLVEDGSGHIWLVRHLAPKTPAFGVIAVDLGRKADGVIREVRSRVDEVLAEAAATLERLDVARAIDEARMRSETDVLREALIGSVSHELRTPLASILGSATVLSNTPVIAQDERLSALTDVIRGESERLNSDIQNLLDSTRITTQSLRPRQQWLEPSDIINSALERRRQRLAKHTIVTEVAEDLPLLYADPVLIEQALVQLLDNAAKYAPADTTITVTACHESDRIVLSVSDRGAGFTAEERERVGQRFFRGERHLASIPGSGLGLWIANAFVTASGGELQTASSGAGHGSTVSMLLSLPSPAVMPVERDADD